MLSLELLVSRMTEFSLFILDLLHDFPFAFETFLADSNLLVSFFLVQNDVLVFGVVSLREIEL